MNWNLLQYYILSSRLYFKYLLVVSLILISALICYLLVAPNKQTVSSTFFLEQKTSSNPLLPFQQNSGGNGKLFETQKHILKSKRLFSDLKEDYLLDVERMYINKDLRLERLLGISFGSDTKKVEKLDDRTLQKMFLSQVSMSFNSNASTIEISYVGNSKKTSKNVLDKIAFYLEIINNEKNLELQSKKAIITRKKVNAAKQKLDIINKKIEDFIIAKNFPEEDSYTSGEYSEFFLIRRELINGKNKLAIEKTKYQFLSSAYERMKELTKDSYSRIDENKFERLSKDLKEFKEAKKLYLAQGDYQMVDYIDAQIVDIKKIIDDSKNGTSELLSRETLQKLLSKALEEKEQSLTSLNAAKTNYKLVQEDFRKSEDKLATIPALRNQLNKLLIERKQSRKVFEMLTELSLKADNENIVSDFSFYKLDDAVFSEGRLGNKLKIFLIGSAFLVFLSSLMLFAISYFRGLVLHNDHLHQPFIESAGRIPLIKIDDWQSELLRYEDISLATFEIDRHLGEDGKTIVMTSTKAESGKTISTLLLAYSFLKRDKKVLIINSDRRSKYINGINNVLARFFKHKEHKEIVRFSTQFGTLYMWRPRSSRNPNQDGGVSLTKEVKKFIDRAENKFDIIIIDAPPLEYTEARALAIVADGVIFCCPEGGISFGEFYENTRKVNELCNGKVLSLLTKSKIQSNSSLTQYQTELAVGGDYDY